MKVYLFYLKKTKNLYALTEEKEYAKLFLKQRNPKLFKYFTLDLSNEYDKKSYQNICIENNTRINILCLDILSDGKTDYEIVLTRYEKEAVSESYEYLVDTIDSIRFSRHKNEFLTGKELKALDRLTALNYENHESCRVNTIKIFIELFDFTIYKKATIPNIELYKSTSKI